MKLKDMLQGDVLIDANWLECPIEVFSQMYSESGSGISIINGVGIYAINGPIMPAGFTSFWSGKSFVSYEAIASELTKLSKDSDVNVIMPVYNTPGGVVDGVDECASIISGINKIKPVISFSSTLCASGGYWLASAAGEIVVTRVARLGSIGVVQTVQLPDDQWSMDITSTLSPDKRPDPRTPEGKAAVLKSIDPVAKIFVDVVAKNRGVSFDYVVSNFGKGGLITGQDCVDVKMADRLVSSFDDLLKEKIGNTARKSGVKTKVSVDNLGRVKMDIAALKKDHSDLYAEVVAEAVKDLENTLAAKEAEVLSMKRKFEASESVKTELQTKIDAAEGDRVAFESRIKALEKDAMIRGEVVLKIEASTIINTALEESQLPERMHTKICDMIRSDSFIKDGVLDKDGFQAHVNEEIKSWTETINAAGPIQGISSGPVKPSANAEAIVDRMFARIAPMQHA